MCHCECRVGHRGLRFEKLVGFWGGFWGILEGFRASFGGIFWGDFWRFLRGVFVQVLGDFGVFRGWRGGVGVFFRGF